MKQILLNCLVGVPGLLGLCFPHWSPAQESVVLEYAHKAYQHKDSGRYDSVRYYLEQANLLISLENPDPALGLAVYTIPVALAEAYLYQGDYAQAESLYESVSQYLPATRAGDSLRAEIIHATGDLRYNQGDFEAARKFLNQGLDLKKQVYGPHHISVSESYTVLGHVFADEGVFDKARNYYDKALEICLRTQEKNSPYTADAYQNLGLLAYMQGDYEDAVDKIQHSYSIEKEIYPKVHPNLASTYNNLGVMYDVKGDYRQALKYYEAALEIRKATLGEGNVRVAQSLHNIGVLYHQRGDYRRALANYTQALYITEEVLGNTLSEQAAGSLENLGSVHLQLKAYDKAKTNFEKALELHKQIFGEKHLYVAQNLQELANIYIKEGAFDVARGLLEEARKILVEVRPDYPDLVYIYESLGELGKAQGLYEEALAEFEKARLVYAKGFPAQHPGLAQLYNQIAEVHALRGNRKTANAYYQKALVANEYTGNNLSVSDSISRAEPIGIMVYLQSLEGKALNLMEGGGNGLSQAADLWEQALYHLRQAQLDMPYRASKLDLREKSRSLCEGAISTYIQLFHLTQDPEYLKKAYEVAEFSQSALLHEWLQELQAMKKAGLPDELLELDYRLGNSAGYYEKKLYELGVAGSVDSSLLREYQAKLFQCRSSQDSLMKALERTYPPYFDMKYQSRVLDFSDIEDQLTPQEKVLRYFLTPEHLYIFSLSQGGVAISVEALDPHFTQKVLEVYHFVQANPLTHPWDSISVTSFISNAHELYQVLLAPVVDDKTQSLYIIPDGILSYLPFEVLIQEPVADFRSYSDLPYALKEFDIGYAYSTHLFFSPIDQGFRREFMGFAPDYKEVDKELMGKNGFPLASLTYNLQEVETLSGLMRGEAILGNQASEYRFKQMSSKGGILHMAMHGILEDQNPLYSHLVFAQADTAAEDNLLHTYELFNLSLEARLAVLSACHSGMGEIQQGEGMMSLARGFQYAGCPNLVMALWQTEDRAASVLMKSFYEESLGDTPFAKALSSAKRKYLSTEDRAHPFFWANFMYIGQRTQLPSKDYSWIWGLMGLLGVAGGFVLKKRFF